MTRQAAEIARVLSVSSEDAMFEFLTGLNVSGVHPELACSMAEGGAFLATLTDPDADHVYIIRSASDGREHCCECSHEGGKCHEFRADPWPRYPVLALVTEWPDPDRCEADDIDTWWVCPQGNGCLPGCSCDPMADDSEPRLSPGGAR